MVVPNSADGALPSGSIVDGGIVTAAVSGAEKCVGAPYAGQQSSAAVADGVAGGPSYWEPASIPTACAAAVIGISAVRGVAGVTAILIAILSDVEAPTAAATEGCAAGTFELLPWTNSVSPLTADSVNTLSLKKEDCAEEESLSAPCGRTGERAGARL